MEQISFIIPDNNTIQNINSSDTASMLHEDKSPDNKHIVTDYTKIVENVYRFGNNNINMNDDIYVLYNDACQKKTENKILAIELFKKCQKLIKNSIKNDVNLKYEIFINLALLVSDTGGSSEEVDNYYQESLNIYPDRAEPYYYWSIYCNKNNKFEKSYELLSKALLLSYDGAVVKYPETQKTAYDKYLYDELSVACYWLKKYNKAKILLDIIIDDPVFSENKERLSKNLELIKKEM